MAASILTIDDRLAGNAGQEGSATASDWGPYSKPTPGAGGGETRTPAENGRTLLGAAIGLRAALEQTGDSIAAPRLAALLESEAALAAALAVLPLGGADFGEDRHRILHELARARDELQRCRRLGSALSETVKHALGERAGTGDYGPDGQPAGRGDRSVGTLQTRG